MKSTGVARHLSRRSVLRAGGTALSGLLAGCSTVSDLFGPSVERRWQVTLDGGVLRRPALAEGMLYVADNSRTLTAIDAATGEVPWTKDFEDRVSPPTVADGRVYVSTRDAYAFTAEGDRLWRTPLGNSSLEAGAAPAIDDVTAHFVTHVGTVVTLATDTGDERWREETDVQAAWMARSDGMIYLSGFDGALQALSAADGAVRWGYGTGEGVDFDVSDGMVYLGTGWGDVIALDAESSVRQWKYAPDTSVYRRPTLVDGTVYAPGYGSTGRTPALTRENRLAGPGVVDALDAESGERRWRVGLDDGVQPGPATVDSDTVYVGDSDGVVTALERNGEARWRHDVGSEIFAGLPMSDGVMYVATEDGVVALDVP